MRRSAWTLRHGALALTVLVASCGPGANDPAQGGVSAKEAAALNDAAAMLDDNGQDAIVETNTTDADTAENTQ